MNKTKAFVKQLEKFRDKIGKDRDELRNFLADAEDLAETCDRAYEAIEEAIQSLSELA